MKFFKKILFLIFTLTFFCFSCCTSVENIYTLPTEEGSLIFLRPVNIKNKDNPVSLISFDITLINKDNKIIEQASIKYTLTSDELNTALSSTLCLKKNDRQIICDSPELIFKRINPATKKFEARFEQKIDSEKFLDFLKADAPAAIVIKYENGNENLLTSKDFDNKLMELSLILL